MNQHDVFLHQAEMLADAAEEAAIENEKNAALHAAVPNMVKLLRKMHREPSMPIGWREQIQQILDRIDGETSDR